MHVGLDAIPLATERTGVGHYTFELARHLAISNPPDSFELISPFDFKTPVSTTAELPSNLHLVKAKANALRRRWFAVGLPLYARRSRLSLFHGTNYEVPLWGPCPSVMTIHDLSLLLHPSTHEERLVRRARMRLPLMVRRASFLITPSESVRREVCEQLKVAPAKVVAIPEAARGVFRPLPAEQTLATRRRLKLEDGFILFVGTIEPRKNLLALLRAFEELSRSTALRPQLVIAGKKGWLTDEFFSYLKSSGLEERLCFTGYLTDEELCALYSSCTVFVYPSLYEGFGLPPLEAMACGAPVITSGIPAIIETVGTEAAELVAPNDVQALAARLSRLLQDERRRQQLSLAGRERAAQFSWEKTARLTREVYDAALKIKER